MQTEGAVVEEVKGMRLSLGFDSRGFSGRPLKHAELTR